MTMYMIQETVRPQMVSDGDMILDMVRLQRQEIVRVYGQDQGMVRQQIWNRRWPMSMIMTQDMAKDSRHGSVDRQRLKIWNIRWPKT